MLKSANNERFTYKKFFLYYYMKYFCNTFFSFYMTGPFKILLAEEDVEVAMITKNFLTSRGYPTLICNNGRDTLHIFRSEKLNFLLINVSLSYVNGFDVVKEIRRINREIPIILFGGKVNHSDIIKGFQAGADDFMMRPFSMEELGLRIEAILKRLQINEQNQHVFPLGRYTFDTTRHVLVLNGKERRLTTKEMDLLMLFYEYLNRVVERQLALKRIWNQENYFNARNMDVYIKKLRNMLCEDPNIKLENVHGVGYKLVIYNEL